MMLLGAPFGALPSHVLLTRQVHFHRIQPVYLTILTKEKGGTNNAES